MNLSIFYEKLKLCIICEISTVWRDRYTQVPAFLANDMKIVLIYYTFELWCAHLCWVKFELCEAPLTTSVVHNSRQHVKVAFRVFGGAAGQEVVNFEDVNRAFVTGAGQVFTLDIKRQVADSRRRGSSTQLTELWAILRIEYSDEGPLDRGGCEKCALPVQCKLNTMFCTA